MKKLVLSILVAVGLIGSLKAQILYTLNANGLVGEYNATTGAAINSFPTFRSDTYSIAVSGNNLYVGNYYYGVGLYDATTGAAINSSLISSYCNSIAVSGNNLYVGNYNGVGLYDATTGAAINSSLISGHSQSLAVSGVPEPSTYALLGVGAIGMLVVIRRKKTA